MGNVPGDARALLAFQAAHPEFCSCVKAYLWIRLCQAIMAMSGPITMAKGILRGKMRSEDPLQ